MRNILKKKRASGETFDFAAKSSRSGTNQKNRARRKKQAKKAANWTRTEGARELLIEGRTSAPPMTGEEKY